MTMVIGISRSSGVQFAFSWTQFPWAPKSQRIAVLGSRGIGRYWGLCLLQLNCWDRKKQIMTHTVGCNCWRWPSTLYNCHLFGCLASSLSGILAFHPLIALFLNLFLFYFLLFPNPPFSFYFLLFSSLLPLILYSLFDPPPIFSLIYYFTSLVTLVQCTSNSYFLIFLPH